MEALFMSGETMLYRGDFAGARDRFATAVAEYDDRERTKSWAAHTGHDAGVTCRSNLAVSLWHLGYPDQALKVNREMLQLARAIGHPFSLAYALHHTGWLYQYCRLGAGTWPAGPRVSRADRYPGELPRIAGHGPVPGLLASARSPRRDLTLEVTVLPLATDPELLRSDQLPIWQSVARPLARRHARGIARTAFAAHCDGPGSWYPAESPAEEIIVECIRADPEGVWAELSRFLEEPAGRQGFVMNLPTGLADLFPQETVLSWAAVSPGRAVVLARLAAPNFQDDQSLAAILADQHGDREDVSHALFGQLFGAFVDGPWSQRWAEHAAELERVARRTRRDGLRRWASRAAEDCRTQEAIYRTQEEEAQMDG
jgi:hypothetical protein